MKKIIIIVFVWLVIVNIFALVALNRFNLNQDTAYKWMAWSDFSQKPNWNIIDLHNRWDSYWYLDIVRNGYYIKTDNTLSNVVFFPLYPALMKIIGTVLGGNFVLAGWLVSIISLLMACVYFYKLVKEFHPEVDPILPIILMLIFPTAFFFNVIYTEALFLFLTVACFYYAFKKNFYLAGFFAFLGALAHSNGVFLAMPILWEMWKTYGWKNLITPKIIPILLAPFGSFLFLLYDYLRFGDPFLFFKIQSAWGRSFKINWEHFSSFSNPSIVNMGIDIFLAILILIAIIITFKKLSSLYAIFMSATIIAAFTSGTLMSVGRYSLVMFPLFILLASVKNKLFQQAWILASVLFLALDIILFVNYYWAG